MREESQLDDPHTNLYMKKIYKVVQLTSIRKEIGNQLFLKMLVKTDERKSFYYG